MAPTLPRLTSGAALSSSTAGSKPDIITLSSSDDAPRLPSGAADVVALSSDDGEQEASSWKGSSSAGSKAGPVVLSSSDYDSDADLLADCRAPRPPCNVVWLFSDEVDILSALADERHESGRLPRSQSALFDAISLRADLKRENPTAGDVARKVHNLKQRFKRVIASGGPSGDLRDRKLYDLCMRVWPEELLPPTVHNSLSSSSSS